MFTQHSLHISLNSSRERDRQTGRQNWRANVPCWRLDQPSRRANDRHGPGRSLLCRLCTNSACSTSHTHVVRLSLPLTHHIPITTDDTSIGVGANQLWGGQDCLWTAGPLSGFLDRPINGFHFSSSLLMLSVMARRGRQRCPGILLHGSQVYLSTDRSNYSQLEMAMRAQRRPPATTHFYAALRLQKSLITKVANNSSKDWGGWVNRWRSHCRITSGPVKATRGIRARVRAAGKALEGDDRYRRWHKIRPLYADYRLITDQDDTLAT